MPNYRVHERFNMIVLFMLIIATIAYVSIRIDYLIYGSIAFIFSTYFISPDLDVKCKAYDRWSVLKYYWLPYRYIMKHRGYSHNAILGPVPLIMYAAVPLLPLLLYVEAVLLIPMTIGAILAIECHILLDKVM